MTKQDPLPTETSVIEQVPLDSLTLSDLNPRKTVSEAHIDTLAASIARFGLIQNLAGLRQRRWPRRDRRGRMPPAGTATDRGQGRNAEPRHGPRAPHRGPGGSRRLGQCRKRGARSPDPGGRNPRLRRDGGQRGERGGYRAGLRRERGPRLPAIGAGRPAPTGARRLGGRRDHPRRGQGLHPIAGRGPDTKASGPDQGPADLGGAVEIRPQPRRRQQQRPARALRRSGGL